MNKPVAEPGRILLAGARSYVGRHLSEALRAAGLAVAGVARSADAAAALAADGVEPVRCDLAAVADATEGLRDYDACIWMSSIPWAEEAAVLAPLLEALRGSGKAFIFTSGTSVLGTEADNGQSSSLSFAETDNIVAPPWARVRLETEQFVRAFSHDGVRSMVIRPPLIWGNGGSRQIPWIFRTAQLAGAAYYVGAGLNAYSHVHVEDLAALYALALSKGHAGGLYHAVAGEEDFKTLAEAVAHVMACTARSVPLEEMGRLIGRAEAMVGFGINSRSLCPVSRDELGWRPSRTDLVGDIRHGSYAERFRPSLI